VSLKLVVTDSTMNPIRLVLQTLNLGKWSLSKLGVGKVNSHSPTRIIEGANLNAKTMLPVTVALRMIPPL